MINKSSGIPYTPSGNTSIIKKYISKVLVPLKQKKQTLPSLENSRKKIVVQENLKMNQNIVNPPP